MADPSIMFGGFKAGAETGDGRTCGCCGTDTCNVVVCVSACPTGDPLPGATVTINSFTPCTTGSDGCCVVDIGAAGVYELIVSADGYTTFDTFMPMACGQQIDVVLFPEGDPPSVVFTVTGCCGGLLPGATVKITKGTKSYSCITDSFGTCSFRLFASGTYTWKVSKARFDDATGSFSVGMCDQGANPISVGLTPAAGYVCTSFCVDPLPTTIHYSDSLYGALTLTYNPVNFRFEGSGSASYPGGCPSAPMCPAVTSDWFVTVDANCESSVVQPELQAEQLPGFINPPTCPVASGSTSPLSVSPVVVMDSVSCNPFVYMGHINNCTALSVLAASNGYPGVSGSTTSVTITE